LKITTNVHTIFLLVGSTECGKTTFANNILIPGLAKKDESRNYETNVQYISSDAIRRELLGINYSKHSQVMLEASEQAFELLFTKLKMVTSFPINAEFVVVDTIGLSEEFRDQVIAIAKEKSYNVDVVLFDYKNVRDYYSSDLSKRLIENHVARLRREVIPNLKRGKYQNVHRIREKNFFDSSAFEIEIENMEEYISRKLPSKYEYLIVGDVHEQVSSFKALLSRAGYKIENDMIEVTEKTKNVRILLIGDWIDKGTKTKETIEFIYKNRSWFFFIKGNHENFVSKYLRGELKDSGVGQDLINDFFTSIATLEKDEALREKFYELVDESKEFYHYISDDRPSYFVTHAPCKNKYIGKMDAHSSRQQRTFRLDRDTPTQEQLMFLEEESVINHPFHVFGHVAAKKYFRIKNKLGIDTGAASGNELTGVKIFSRKPFFIGVSSNENEVIKQEELPILFPNKGKRVNIDELEQKDRRRLNYIVKNGINFISGTMSPADKDKETNELESLKQGLNYYKDKGVKQVILQPKYMGSRCNVYLSSNIEECYAVSRNGFRVRSVELSNIFKNLQGRFSEYMEKEHISYLVFDGELLPWSALGKGLIEDKFNVVSKALGNELSFLKENGFDEHFALLNERFYDSGFNEEEVRGTKQELIAKFGHNEYETFKNMKSTLKSYVSVEKHEALLSVYDEQLKIYGSEAKIDYKPFNLLKIIKKDGTEIFPSDKMTTEEIFKFISDDECSVVSFEDESYLEKAQSYYITLTTDRKMEGVVVKPDENTPNIAPFLKVRNENYLTLVYGYDYKLPHKYKKLLDQKRISKKLNMSVQEHKLGKRMLETPISEITPDNDDYKQIIANKLFEEQKQSGIDPRL